MDALVPPGRARGRSRTERRWSRAHPEVAAVTGLPLHRLVVRHRLRQALERVLDTRESLSAIAFSTGFSSHSHLTDAFRREFGCTPAVIRRRSPAELRTLLGYGARAFGYYRVS